MRFKTEKEKNKNQADILTNSPCRHNCIDVLLIFRDNSRYSFSKSEGIDKKNKYDE